MKNVKRFSIVVFVSILIVLSTFAYSALATSFSITSNVRFRVLADIRVTSSKISSSTPATNGAVIAYESRFNIDSVSNGFTLPNTNSRISYDITVENYGDIDQVIYEMTKTSGNSGLFYTITGYDDKEIIPIV